MPVGRQLWLAMILSSSPTRNGHPPRPVLSYVLPMMSGDNKPGS